MQNGREVNVARRRSSDARAADLHFALNHAFKRAQRVLQVNVRRMRGDVKWHQPRDQSAPSAESE